MNIKVLSGSKIRRVNGSNLLDIKLGEGVTADIDYSASLVAKAKIGDKDCIVYDFSYKGEDFRGWSYAFEVQVQEV